MKATRIAHKLTRKIAIGGMFDFDRYFSHQLNKNTLYHHQQEISNHHQQTNPTNFQTNLFHFSLDETQQATVSKHNYLVMLNTPYFTTKNFSTGLFMDLWNSCEFKYCADGGANRLFEFVSAMNKENILIPNVICGDLDSLNVNIGKFYEKQGTSIVKITEQDSNDLQKCVRTMKEEIIKGFIDPKEVDSNGTIFHRIFIIGGGGRLDQEMCDLNTLYIEALLRASNPQHNFQFVMITPYSLIHVLVPGKHQIHRNIKWEKTTCALIPLGMPCESVTTTGLEWNLSGDRLEFGGLVSTSNNMLHGIVTIETSHPLLWVTSLNNTEELNN